MPHDAPHRSDPAASPSRGGPRLVAARPVPPRPRAVMIRLAIRRTDAVQQACCCAQAASGGAPYIAVRPQVRRSAAARSRVPPRPRRRWQRSAGCGAQRRAPRRSSSSSRVRPAFAMPAHPCTPRTIDAAHTLAHCIMGGPEGHLVRRAGEEPRQAAGPPRSCETARSRASTREVALRPAWPRAP